MINFLNISLNSKKIISTLKKRPLKGFVGPGLYTKKCEKQILKITKSNYCVLTTSGTIALTLAALSLNLKKNDEIIVPAYGVISTSNAFASIGLKIKFCEIEKKTGSISLKYIKKNLSKKTKAICFVNFSGYVGSELIKIKKYCKSKKIYLIEDSACALGNYYKGISAGNFGDIGTFSLSSTKTITTGQGGIVIFKSKKHYKKCLEILDQGANNWRQINNHKKIGTNLRFNDILASFLLPQLQNLREIINKRKKIYNIIFKNLKNNFFYISSFNSPLYNIIFTNKRKQLSNFLSKKNIKTIIQYKRINKNTCYKDISNKNFPNAKFWEDYALFLPIGSGLNNKNAKAINRLLIQKKNMLINL